MNQVDLSSTVSTFLKKRLSSKDTQVFLFGSAVRGKKFRDVDIGIMGSVEPGVLSLLREDFEESQFPYIVDIVDFSQVDSEFKDRVFSEKVCWLDF